MARRKATKRTRGRPRIHASNAVKQAEYRDRLLAARLDAAARFWCEPAAAKYLMSFLSNEAERLRLATEKADVERRAPADPYALYRKEREKRLGKRTEGWFRSGMRSRPDKALRNILRYLSQGSTIVGVASWRELECTVNVLCHAVTRKQATTFKKQFATIKRRHLKRIQRGAVS